MKYTIAISLLLFGLLSCRLSRIDFKEDNLTVDYAKQLIRVAGGYKPNHTIDPETGKPVDERNKIADSIDLAFDSIQVYRSELEDALVLRDNLVEETIRNKRRKGMDEPEMQLGNSYQIYLVTTGTRGGSAALMIPSIFTAKGECIGLGPAWVGTWNAKEFKFYKTIRYKAYGKRKQQRNREQGQETGRWVYSRKENEDPRTRSIYVDEKKTVLWKSIRVVTDQAAYINTLDTFRLVKIFRTSENSIGADKHLAFDIGQIFGDPGALYFKRRK